MYSFNEDDESVNLMGDSFGIGDFIELVTQFPKSTNFVIVIGC
jgi:hypothetical protein